MNHKIRNSKFKVGFHTHAELTLLTKEKTVPMNSIQFGNLKYRITILDLFI